MDKLVEKAKKYYETGAYFVLNYWNGLDTTGKVVVPVTVGGLLLLLLMAIF